MADDVKRPAFEAPADLIRDVQSNPHMKRPSAIGLGAVLIFMRAIAGIIWFVALAALWNTEIAEEFDEVGVSPEEWDLVNASLLTSILIFGAVVVLAQMALAVLVYRGSNWARIVVMLVATSSIVLSFIEWSVGGQEITIRTTLITLALDILVLLALSSRAARAYARRPRPAAS